jgi:cytochrome c551/c552
MRRAARLAAIAFAPLAASCAWGQPVPGPPDPGAIVADVACNSCHAQGATAAAPPAAPDWPKIAARWRSDPQAEEKLAAIIVGGTRERHWAGAAMLESMLPQAPWVKPEEARAVARWILAGPPKP